MPLQKVNKTAVPFKMPHSRDTSVSIITIDEAIAA